MQISTEIFQMYHPDFLQVNRWKDMVSVYLTGYNGSGGNGFYWESLNNFYIIFYYFMQKLDYALVKNLKYQKEAKWQSLLSNAIKAMLSHCQCCQIHMPNKR